MKKYSHQFLVALTVETEEGDPAEISEKRLITELALRLVDIVAHDGIEAFQHNGTEEV